jgi:DNA-binding protein YbaB
MPVHPPPPPRLPFDAGDVSQALERLLEGSIEASVDNLVRVRVGRAMNVIAVELLDPSLDRAVKQRLETAVVGALNTALQRAALAAGQALAELEKHGSARAAK